MPEYFQHCPGCGARFQLKLEDTKMVHLERETYRRTETTSPGAAIGGTSGGARFGLERPILVTEGPPKVLYIEDFQYTYKCQHCGHVWTERHEETRSEPSLTPGNRFGARWSRLVIALLIIGLVATASILGSAYALHWLGNNGNSSTLLSCGSPTSNNPHNFHFTIVMSTYGYNYSILHSIPPPGYREPAWPRMNVTVGSNVIIRALNNDTSHVLGFVILKCVEQAVTSQPGGSSVITFRASTPGTFTIRDPYGYTKSDVTGHVPGYAQLNVS